MDAGPQQEAVGVPREELGVAWNGKGIKAKGLAVYVLLGVLAIVGSNLYAGYRGEQMIARIAEGMSKEHVRLALAQDRTSCIVTLTFEQREQFRKDFRPGAFRQWCPWVQD
jgi:hypothetical protein